MIGIASSWMGLGSVRKFLLKRHHEQFSSRKKSSKSRPFVSVTSSVLYLVSVGRVPLRPSLKSSSSRNYLAVLGIAFGPPIWKEAFEPTLTLNCNCSFFNNCLFESWCDSKFWCVAITLIPCLSTDNLAQDSVIYYKTSESYNTFSLPASIFYGRIYVGVSIASKC
jgi:hypothetical protein